MQDIATSLPMGPAPQMPRTSNTDPRRTAQEFEAVFIGQMTKIMMDTAPADGPFTGGHGEEMFRGVMAEELGNAIAKRGGIGLAPMVMQQIIRMQGGE